MIEQARRAWQREPKVVVLCIAYMAAILLLIALVCATAGTHRQPGSTMDADAIVHEWETRNAQRVAPEDEGIEFLKRPISPNEPVHPALRWEKLGRIAKSCGLRDTYIQCRCQELRVIHGLPPKRDQ